MGQSMRERAERVGWDITQRGCWEWRGVRNKRGYGLLYSPEGKYLRAHRVLYESTNGPIPEGLVVRHRCDNPPCCNPAHLELGTQADNMRDMVVRGRDKSYASGRYGGECAGGRHTISGPDDLVYDKRGAGSWHCRECKREANRRYLQRKRG